MLDEFLLKLINVCVIFKYKNIFDVQVFDDSFHLASLLIAQMSYMIFHLHLQLMFGLVENGILGIKFMCKLLG